MKKMIVLTVVLGALIFSPYFYGKLRPTPPAQPGVEERPWAEIPLHQVFGTADQKPGPGVPPVVLSKSPPPPVAVEDPEADCARIADKNRRVLCDADEQAAALNAQRRAKGELMPGDATACGEYPKDWDRAGKWVWNKCMADLAAAGQKAVDKQREDQAKQDAAAPKAAEPAAKRNCTYGTTWAPSGPHGMGNRAWSEICN